MKKLYALFFMTTATLVGFGFEVSNVRVGEVSPWTNGLVSIFYDVTGPIPPRAEEYFCEMKVRDLSTGKNYAGDRVNGDCGLWSGTHKVTWDKDVGASGLYSNSFSASNAVVDVRYVRGDYCIIDLSGGSAATSYPVSYVDEIPGGDWSDEYKTTKMVLKRVPKGTFIMGETTDESHRVTLTKSFYIGIFELTQKQFRLVMGDKYVLLLTYGLDDKCPVYDVGNFFRNVRYFGEDSNFLNKLRSRTGLAFYLPTEAQWEYACRAGSTTRYCYGDSYDDDYLWCSSNTTRTRTVGTRKANAWGLYDMHGNVSEMCLSVGEPTPKYGVDPSPWGEVLDHFQLRGGSFKDAADLCLSSYRCSPVDAVWGVRLIIALP